MSIPLSHRCSKEVQDFKTCQLCGYKSDDICNFDLWQEGPESGEEPTVFFDTFLIIGRRCGCENLVFSSPYWYRRMPWSRGGPGRFILVCGDCPFRQHFQCLHPSLKANGGDGLEVIFRPMIPGLISVCTTDGRNIAADLIPAIRCEGNDRSTR